MMLKANSTSPIVEDADGRSRKVEKEVMTPPRLWKAWFRTSGSRVLPPDGGDYGFQYHLIKAWE